MNAPELRLLRYFVAVAEELHFGRAARRLHVAQPGLSQQIRALETALGARLLERTSRQVRLTPAGELLLAESRRLLAEAERAVDRVRRVARGEAGRITVAAIGSATYDVVPRLLRALRTRAPEVELVLREMSTPAQVHALRAGEIDVGFLRLPADTSGLLEHTVREDRMAIMVPETHPLARRRRVPLRALAREPLVVFPAAPRPSWADTVIAACRETGFEPIVAQEAMESATVVSFVAAGVGVAPVPEGLKVLARPGVAFRLVTPPAPVTRLAAVYRAGELAPAVDGFLALVRELWPRPASAERAPSR